MKVTGTQGIDPRAVVTDPPRTVTDSQTPAMPRTDKVETSSPQIFQQAQASQAERHTQRLNKITQEVKLGTYTWPSAQTIASKILDAQQLTAHLRSLLG